MRFLSSVVVIAAVVASGAVAPVQAAGPDRVTFSSGNRAVTVPLTGDLYRAPGAAAKPAAAVVLLHQCAGIDQYTRDWAMWFAARGYTALIVDSLAARRIKMGTCNLAGVTDVERGFDALGALSYLRAQPDVDPKRIAVAGWGLGGGAAIAAAAKTIVDVANPTGGPFRAAFAFYPGCRRMGAITLESPLLMLLAADAATAPSAPCEEAGAKLKSAGQSVEWHTYARVQEDFDNPAESVVGASSARSSTARLVTRFDPGASDDAHARVAAFLAQQLR